ncbi:hypothetical protein Tco_1417672, partial [Tanacetum coccineum]
VNTALHNCFDAQPVAAVDTSPSDDAPGQTNTFYSYQARRASEDRHHQAAELKEKFKISCKRQRILTNSDGSVRTWLKKSIPDIHDSLFVLDVIKPLEIEELMY